MLIEGKAYQSIWYDERYNNVKIIDQRFLPHKLEIAELNSLEESWTAIKDMSVRGAPLIGVTAAFGFALAMRENKHASNIDRVFEFLCSARPTAVNLRWACLFMKKWLENVETEKREKISLEIAQKLAENDVKTNKRIGENGVELIRSIAQKKSKCSAVNILTHCNAGWLATVDRGTATAPIYEAVEQGIPVHIWVDETRPRNQGASLTSWELTHNNINNTLIVDNAGGHLMQKGDVDLVIVGSDRTAANGDVCNKIGTYLKALAAFDNDIPFYAALPTSTIDFNLKDGSEIPIEERGEEEVLEISGINTTGKLENVKLAIDGVKAANPAFDVTPAKYITGLITEKTIVPANINAISKLDS